MIIGHTELNDGPGQYCGVQRAMNRVLNGSIAVLGSVTIAAVAFGAGAMTAIWRGWGQAIAIVDIVNGSNEAVTMVTLLFDTCGHRGSVQAGGMAPGASTQVRYIVCGEGGQIVMAQFADGITVKSADAYVETGYRVTETISRDAISQHITLGLP
jgi:hypothetical protein